MSRDAAARWLGSIADELTSSGAGVSLSPGIRQQVLELHRDSAPDPEVTGTERRAAFQALLASLERLLGAATFESYVRLIERSLEPRILTTKASAR